MACCYWEYARESVSIRGAVEIAKAEFANERVSRPETEERVAFRAAADKASGLLIQTGFDNSFWAGLPFPATWQAVEKKERVKWANSLPKIPTPVQFPPFQVTGSHCVAGRLNNAARQAHEERLALYRSA